MQFFQAITILVLCSVMTVLAGPIEMPTPVEQFTNLEERHDWALNCGTRQWYCTHDTYAYYCSARGKVQNLEETDSDWCDEACTCVNTNPKPSCVVFAPTIPDGVICTKEELEAMNSNSTVPVNEKMAISETTAINERAAIYETSTNEAAVAAPVETPSPTVENPTALEKRHDYAMTCGDTLWNYCVGTYGYYCTSAGTIDFTAEHGSDTCEDVCTCIDISPLPTCFAFITGPVCNKDKEYDEIMHSATVVNGTLMVNGTVLKSTV